MNPAPLRAPGERRIVSGGTPFHGRLTPIEVEALTAARDGANAFECLKDMYGRMASARGRVIADLMKRELLEPIIGPRFGTLTDTGRAALENNLAGRGKRAPARAADREGRG